MISIIYRVVMKYEMHRTQRNITQNSKMNSKALKIISFMQTLILKRQTLLLIMQSNTLNIKKR